MTPIHNPQRSKKSGLGPDTLVYVGQATNAKVQIKLIDYNTEFAHTQTLEEIQSCAHYVDSASVSWLDIVGIHDAAVIEAIGQQFNVHPLVLEDVMNSTSRPKVEFFEHYMFVTLKMLEHDIETGEVQKEQLSLIVSEKYMVMFQEKPGDHFDPIRERIMTSKGKVRNKDGYYLAYLILDTVVDNYIATNETLLAQIEQVEAAILNHPTEHTLHRILALRKEVIDIKRGIDPLKEAINTMAREMDDDIQKYYHDLYDHIIYESENLAMYREMIVNLLDLYHSNLSIKMNQVMKVLTIITTIFVPLTFIVGVYGMNFDNIPELHMQYGYFYVMGGMGIIVIGMLFYFRRKQWL
jgi:magnesium transporter